MFFSRPFSLVLHLCIASTSIVILLFFFVNFSYLVVVCHFQIRSVEAVHRFFEKFPEAFMDKLHVAVPKRSLMFLLFLIYT